MHHTKEPPFTNGWSSHNKTYLKLLTYFLPFAWFQTILLVKMSAELEKEKMAPLTLGELIQFIGMQILMLMLQG